MVLAYHVIVTAYGFWLPNDPRGSWSDFVASWELLLAGGKATRVHTRRSLANAPHDRELRLKTKLALKFPPVVFNGEQARAVGRGFARAITESGYKVYACAILPEHAHLVMGRAEWKIERVMRHLKARASTQLYQENLHPFAGLRRPGGRGVSCWQEKGWSVYLDLHQDIQRAIAYVRRNPLKEGKKEQRWWFETDYG